MGVGNANPFRGWPLLHLFDFIVRRTLFSLYQRAGIGFVLQNADNRCSRPFTVLFVRVPMFGIRKTVVFLIGQWRQDAHII